MIQINSLALQTAVDYAWENYYSKPFPPSLFSGLTELSQGPATIRESKPEKIQRSTHGIQHAVRTVIAMTALAKLRESKGEKVLDQCLHEINRKLSIPLEENDTNKSLIFKLIQWYCIFHDSARKNEAEDLWDKKSAENFYHYAVSQGIAKELALVIAEFGANKDYDPTKADSTYYNLKISTDNKLAWQQAEETEKPLQKPYIAELIHDGDCLDIIRARDWFDIRYLDIYKNYLPTETDSPIIKKFKSRMLRDIALIVAAHHGLIHAHGDSIYGQDREIKLSFENKNCLIETLKILPKLLVLRSILPSEQLSEPTAEKLEDETLLTLTELNEALRKRRLWFRGLLGGHLYRTDFKSDMNGAELEILYTLINGKNSNRPGCLGGYGSHLFLATGFCFLLGSNDEPIKSSLTDIGSGLGDEQVFEADPASFLQVSKALKQGRGTNTHNEIILKETPRVDRYSATPYIYLTQDPVGIRGLQKTRKTASLFFPGYKDEGYRRFILAFDCLCATYLQQITLEQAKLYCPIIQYDTANSRINKFINAFTSEQILAFWQTVFLEIFTFNFNLYTFSNFMDAIHLFDAGMVYFDKYGTRRKVFTEKHYTPLLAYYSKRFREQVLAHLKKIYEELIIKIDLSFGEYSLTYLQRRDSGTATLILTHIESEEIVGSLKTEPLASNKLKRILSKDNNSDTKQELFVYLTELSISGKLFADQLQTIEHEMAETFVTTCEII